MRASLDEYGGVLTLVLIPKTGLEAWALKAWVEKYQKKDSGAVMMVKELEKDVE